MIRIIRIKDTSTGVHMNHCPSFPQEKIDSGSILLLNDKTYSELVPLNNGHLLFS